MFAAVLVAASFCTPPTIIHLIADDLGWDDLGFANGNRTHTPHINAAVGSGVLLTSYHTYKVCSPSRASIMTGRYPWGVGYYDMVGPLVVPLEYTLLPGLLKDNYGYETLAVGKWNLGDVVKDMTPTYRGFDDFIGYYAASLSDYWYHTWPASCKPSPGIAEPPFWTDLSNSSGTQVRPADAKGLNGTYDAKIFADAVVRRIESHAAAQNARAEAGEAEKGLYVYAAFQNVHKAEGALPLHSPCHEVDTLYANTPIDPYKVMGGMVTHLDYGVGNITKALNAAGRPWVMVFVSDNGGPLPAAATNAPYRGGKHTLWEGGLRVRAFVTGSALPDSARGTTWGGLAHSSDWYLTLAEGVAGGNVALPPSVLNATGSRAPDAFNLWPAICSGTDSPRREIIHQVVNNYTNTSGKVGFLKDPAAIQRGNFKLILGDPGAAFGFDQDFVVAWPEPASKPVAFGLSNGSRDEYPEEKGSGAHCRSQVNYSPHTKSTGRCAKGCLFNVETDPGETRNVFDDPEHQDLVARLSARLEEAAATGPEWAWPVIGPELGDLKQKNCDYAATKTNGFVEPATTSLPPP